MRGMHYDAGMQSVTPSLPPSVSRIAFASFIGTAIEFYDFYIFAMAAALVIGEVFFPVSDPAAQSLNALLTFGLAFLARPIGAVLFGHFGDKVGRKSTLAASLLLMGMSTLCIGLLPGYADWGMWAPLCLCLLRVGQGIGLGGEWAGAALLATEYAPAGKRGWYGMFPQLGPSIGFLLATLSFLGLSLWLTDADFKRWGWRLPFIASALLVAVGLYVRTRLAETPAFSQARATRQVVRWPLLTLLRQHGRRILLSALAMAVCYHLFYTATVFCLSYGTQQLHIPRVRFLQWLCLAILAMTLATPLAAAWSDRVGRKAVLMAGGIAAILLGFAMAPLMQSGDAVNIPFFLAAALFLMGVTFAPMGAFLPEQFPVAVRYSGAGLAYQLGGIVGASLAPGVSQWLVTQGGLPWVGAYVSVVATVSVLAVWRLGAAHE